MIIIISLKNTRSKGWVKGKIRARCCSFFLKIFSPSLFLFQEKDHNSEDEDEDKYADDIDMPGQNFDSKRRITVRNLRIREDIAKVSLVNLTYIFRKHLSSQPKFCLLTWYLDSIWIIYSVIPKYIILDIFLFSCTPRHARARAHTHTLTHSLNCLLLLVF